MFRKRGQVVLKIIGGRYGGRLLSAPKTDLRPSMGSVRAALFNILALDIEGACFLDLFAGSGSIGLEALSRGAGAVTFVERERRGTDVIYKNLEKLEEVGTVITSCALRYVEHYRGEPFDILFADPPYGSGDGKRLLELLDRSPILRSGGFCFMEEGKRFNAPALETLELVKERRYGSSRLIQWRMR